MKKIFYFVFVACLISTSVDAKNYCGPEGIIKHIGKVISYFNSGEYTYVQVEEKYKKTWVAMQKTKISKGKYIAFADSKPLIDFEQNKGRRFDEIYFATGYQYVNEKCESDQIHTSTESNHPYKDWLLGAIPKEALYAATINDTGSIFGQYCFYESKSCMYLIAMTARCETNQIYPSLSNSDTGSLNQEIMCMGQININDNIYYRYVFTDFKKIDGIVQSGKSVGFAIPLEQDKFRSIRFSLNGAIEATKIMVDAANKYFIDNSGIENKTSTKRSDEVF